MLGLRQHNSNPHSIHSNSTIDDHLLPHPHIHTNNKLQPCTNDNKNIMIIIADIKEDIKFPIRHQIRK